jgi:hypothetical protein
VPAFVAISDAHKPGFTARFWIPPGKSTLFEHISGCILQLRHGLIKPWLEMSTFSEAADVIWMETQMVYTTFVFLRVVKPKFHRSIKDNCAQKCCGRFLNFFLLATTTDYYNYDSDQEGQQNNAITIRSRQN